MKILFFFSKWWKCIFLLDFTAVVPTVAERNLPPGTAVADEVEVEKDRRGEVEAERDRQGEAEAEIEKGLEGKSQVGYSLINSFIHIYIKSSSFIFWYLIAYKANVKEFYVV